MIMINHHHCNSSPVWVNHSAEVRWWGRPLRLQWCWPAPDSGAGFSASGCGGETWWNHHFFMQNDVFFSMNNDGFTMFYPNLLFLRLSIVKIGIQKSSWRLLPRAKKMDTLWVESKRGTSGEQPEKVENSLCWEAHPPVFGWLVLTHSHTQI